MALSVLVVALVIMAAAAAYILLVPTVPGQPTTGGQSTGNSIMGSPDSVPGSVLPRAGATYNNVDYCNDAQDGGQQVLDIYYPSSGLSGTMPSVVFVHGGGWTKGTAPTVPSWLEQNLTAAGIVVVSINYRMAPQYPFPAAEYDAECAVAYLKQGAGQLHLDPGRIGISGASAGAHIASWVGVNGTGTRYSVAAVGLISAPENVTLDYAGFSAWNAAVAAEFPTPSLAYQGSPVNFVSRADPPYFITHGYNDTVVPYAQALEMYGALKSVGARVTLVMVDDAGHGLKTINGYAASPPVPEVEQEFIDFFVSSLG